MTESITIRPASSPLDYQALQHAQRLAWGITQEEYILPVATMVGANLHGGLVLGAFLDDGRAVGLSFAFLGRFRDQPCLYSQLTGIVPDYQDTGLGTRLKLAQRDFAVRAGLPGIAWAFDPLQAGNARFNLSKLGAQGVHYYVDMYGPRSDALNRGTPTDRLLAWWPVSPLPRLPLNPADLEAWPRLLEVEGTTPRTSPFDPNAPGALIHLPDHIANLRASSPELATTWLERLRSAFLIAFASDWQARDIIRLPRPSGDALFYVLRPLQPTANEPPSNANHLT